MLRVKRADLAERGVVRNEARFAGVATGCPCWTTGRSWTLTVVWATGFRQPFDWINLPVLGDDGWPREYRGVVDDAPGLFFCGLSFQWAFTSMLIHGAGRDAAYVVDRIVARAARTAAASVPA